MIRYGLKLWSNNIDLFEQARELCRSKSFDFVELYNNPSVVTELEAMAPLAGYVETIHNPHTHGWHEFFFASEEQMAHWQRTVAMADFFSAKHIIIHPSREHTLKTFAENFARIADPRILIENMAGQDIYGLVMGCGQSIDDLVALRRLAPICFDIEKGIKGAAQQGIAYKEFIAQALTSLEPEYFHLSSGDSTSPIDQHLNLWEGNFDWEWIRRTLQEYSANRTVRISLETPKMKGTLENDARNVEFFKGSL